VTRGDGSDFLREKYCVGWSAERKKRRCYRANKSEREKEEVKGDRKVE